MSLEENTNILIQNYQLLINEIPKELLNLTYGIYPTDPSYNDVRFIYNKLFNYFPHAIYYPESEKDISYLIKNLAKYKLEFAIRCGGHAYEPASLSIGYIIDVKNFSKIKINGEKKYVKVGSGIRLGTLITELGKKNYITATGESSNVGISGLSLAGGKGYLTRLYGMVCDNILEVKIVNYEGKILKANSKENSDLFWAIKGGGNGNFGVITEFRLKIYNDIRCKITNLTWCNKVYLKEIIQKYQELILKNSIDSIIYFNITYNNQIITYKLTFFVFGDAIKTDDYINNEISSLKNFNNPTVTECDGYYSKITDCWVSYNTGLSPPFSKLKSTMVFTPIISKGIDVIINSFEEMIATKLNLVYQVNLSQLGGKVITGDSSYYPKNALYSVTMPINWTLQIQNKYCIDFINKVYHKLIYYTSVYCFPNMIDYDLTNYMNSYYGSNKERLIDIKTKYDPKNVFHWHQSIPIKK